MRATSWLAGLAFISTGCISIHTIDFGAGRSSLGANCNVPMNRGGQIPSGWQEIGRVQIDGATDWTEAQFAAEIRQQACDMGAEYVVVNGDPSYTEAKFLSQTQQAQQTPPSAPQGSMTPTSDFTPPPMPAP